MLSGLGLLLALYASLAHAALATSGTELLLGLLLESVLPVAAVLVVALPAARRREWEQVCYNGCWLASLTLLGVTLAVVAADVWRAL